MTSTTVTATDALLDAARAAATVDERHTSISVTNHLGEEAVIPIGIVQRGQEIRVEVLREVLNEVERQASGPIRRAGTIELGGLADFISYVNRFKTPDVVVFAPLSPPGVTAIFDFHPSSDGTTLPGTAWCQDRATYRCPLSRQWRTWTDKDGVPFAQGAFGDFLEANELDLATREGFAPATKMLEVARNLVIHSAGKFERRIDPTSGQGTLVVKDEHAENSTKIPPKFALALPVFEGDDTHYVVEARVRFAMVEGRPQFAFILQNKEKVLEDALATLRAKVAAGTGAPVFVGNPPATR